MNANAQDFDPNRGVGGYQQQQHQQYPPNAHDIYGGMQDDYSGTHYDPSTGYQQDYNADAAAFYPPQAEYNWTEPVVPQEPVVPGCYYPTVPGSFQPQLYGAPISALANDDEYEAIYVTSQTQPLGKFRASINRASMMATHSSDGMLYSACAAHPEASQSTLSTIYDTFYRGASSTANQHSVPSHAYQPFGTENAYYANGSVYSKHQLGVTTLMPIKGYVASVSPSAVRVHTHGGLCVSDLDIEGMVAGTLHPGHVHIAVGGIAIGKHHSHVHCLDLYQNLRIVSSNTFRSDDASFGVICMATNHEKQTIVAGCSDGTLRLLDGSFRSRRGGSELAKVKSHAAGVSNVAVSYDGNLVCTTGYASRSPINSNVPYAFPDQNVLIYDVRYLGRGGILHPFSAVSGGPRLVSFIPDMPEQPSNRVLVASGQNKGGIQIITPFDTAGTDFLVPNLAHRESMTALHIFEQYLAIGTSQCNVLQYELAGFSHQTKTASSFGVNAPAFVPSGGGYHGTAPLTSSGHSSMQKKALVLPSFAPELPAMSMDPSLLQSTGTPGVRNGATDKLRSIFTAYVMCADPTTNKDGHSAFNALANNVLLTTPKRNISHLLLTSSSKTEGDVMASVMTSDLGIDLFENERSGNRTGKQEEGCLPNPNRLLHSKKLSALCYGKSETRKNRMGRDPRDPRDPRSRNKVPGRNGRSDNSDDGADDGIPRRYCLTLKPSHSKGAAFSHAQYNDTGLWPGWDYPPSMPNAYAPPVLLLLYFMPEIKSALMARQFDKSGKPNGTAVPPLSAELGCVFHQIDCLSRYARIYPDESMMAKVGAFVPSNLLASFASMPEANALALLDGNPVAVERACRPEAFLRFLLHHLHKELSNKKGGSNIIDTLHGLTFVSINEFITGSGPPVVSKQHSMTVDLSCDPFVKKSEQVKFGEVLRHALSKEAPLRAWCKESRSYETIVQRKIATSLPSVLALSCCCAGNHNKEGLSIWRNNAPENEHWLPEVVEVEIEDNGNVIVREQTDGDGTGEKGWVEFKGLSDLPPAVAAIVKSNLGSTRKCRYRLDGVVSFVRDTAEDTAANEVKGHHVLHARIPREMKRQAYDRQLSNAQAVVTTNEAAAEALLRSEEISDKLTLTSGIKPEVLQQRIQDIEERMKAVDRAENGDDWVLFNGFVVSSTIAEDARAFHVPFKDPCLVIFRAMDDNGSRRKKQRKNSDSDKDSKFLKFKVFHAISVYSGRKPPFFPTRPNMLPGHGDLIAFDAEFVCVQEEESELTDRGSKVTVRETRLALARMSVIDCKSGTVILDDYVVPSEPVVDYLTRFSGITAADLDPKTSPHYLVTTQSAYLKLRYLVESGCIFVGHGLSQDFLTVNLVVPPNQIIDTVEVFHQDRMRWISLRFLTNYVFGRDMQQDVHDSVEDARAAHALYLKALELKKEGTFDKFLQDLYVYGAARDWKLGVDE